MNAIEKYNSRSLAVNSLVCVGLDTVIASSMINNHIIEQTAQHVSAYKFNMSFYMKNGSSSIFELEKTLSHLRYKYPEILTICDVKYGDVSSSSEAYAQSIFEELGFDAVTLNPYLGRDAIQPFLDYEDKGCIVLCRTTNPGAFEFQDLMVGTVPLWQHVLQTVISDWNENGNCMLVMGGTKPYDVAFARDIDDDITLLIPGIGTQGASVRSAVRAGMNSEGSGIIINSSRGIATSDDPYKAVMDLQREINEVRKESNLGIFAR